MPPMLRGRDRLVVCILLTVVALLAVAAGCEAADERAGSTSITDLRTGVVVDATARRGAAEPVTAFRPDYRLRLEVPVYLAV